MVFIAFFFCGFASATANRTLDPLTAAIADDLSIPVASIALLSSVLAVTYALSQPLIGPLGDQYGKALVLKLALWMCGLFVLASAFAPGYSTLMVFRALTGFAAGGLVPVGMAMIGDLFEARFRQIAIARFIMSAIIGQIAGALLAGSLESIVGWRGVLLVCAVIVFTAAVIATVALRDPPATKPARFSFGAAKANYLLVFSSGRAWVCFFWSFIAGCFGFGLLPFIAPILESQNNGGAREAGFIIAAFGAGALILAVSLPLFLRVLSRPSMMFFGVLTLAVSMAAYAIGLHWGYQTILLGIFGFGFFMKHNSIQAEVSDVAPEARTTAYAMHSLAFFTGHAMGPATYGAEIALMGTRTTLALNALIMFCAGGMIARYFFCYHQAIKTAPGTS